MCNNFQGRIGKNISSTILFEVILMGERMKYGIMFFHIWDAQNKIYTIQQRHITKNRIKERYNEKGYETTWCDHETRFVLMNLP